MLQRQLTRRIVQEYAEASNLASGLAELKSVSDCVQTLQQYIYLPQLLLC